MNKPTKYYLVDSLSGTPDIEISRFTYYLLVGSLATFLVLCVLAVIAMVLTV